MSFLVLAGLTGAALCAEPPMRVLVLTPFSREIEPFAALTSEFRSSLVKELRDRVEVGVFPLDLVSFSDPRIGDGDEPLVRFLEERLKDRPADLVVPIGGTAMQFAHRHRDRLFADVPLLLVGAEPRMVPPDLLSRDVVLVSQRIDLPGIIREMLHLQPETRHIAVVLGASPIEKHWVAQMRTEFAPFASKVEFLWLDGLPLDETVDRCAALPPNSFVLHALFLVDGDGIPCERNEALIRLHHEANAPLYSPFESEFGLGPIGGRLFRNSAIGMEAAGVAARILRGKRPADVPVHLGDGTPIYDWRELRRWGISESVLPPGSTVAFREPGFLRRYGWQTAGGVAFMLLQSALLLGLWTGWNRWRREEAAASLIAEISARFVNLPAGEVDREILEAQRRITSILGIDVAALWQWEGDTGDVLLLTHLHGEVRVRPPERMEASAYFPWLKQRMAEGHKESFSSLAKLPAEAARDRASFELFGIQSCLTLPLGVGGEPPIGVLGFNTTRRQRTWPESEVKRLQVVAGIFTNALARKRTDQALKESERRLGLAADAANAGLWELDLATQCYWVTDRTRSLFGFAPEDVVTLQSFKQMVEPADRPLIDRVIAEAIRTRETLSIEYRVRRPDGQLRWFASQGRSFFSAEGTPERLIGLSMDITKRKEEERRIRDEEARLSAGFDLAGLGHYEFDFSSNTCFIDGHFHRICGTVMGHNRATPVLEEWFRQVHPEDLQMVLEEDAKLKSGRAERVSLQHRFVHPHDGVKWLLHFCGVAQRDAGGAVLRTYGVIRDVTDQHRAEMETQELRAALAHTGRVTILGQLASALAHELSQPLGAILRNAEAAEILLAQADPDMEEIRAIIGDILRDDHRAGSVIEKLRSFLKRGVLEPRLLDLHEVVVEVLSLCRGDALGRRVSLVSLVPRDLPCVVADRIHLQQVILNLVVNAMDAIDGAGSALRRVEVSARFIGSSEIETCVCDSGPGIAEDILPRLFDPFFTTKPNGMGMGLPVSRALAKAQGGTLTAVNRREGGACFCLTLPAAP